MKRSDQPLPAALARLLAAALLVSATALAGCGDPGEPADPAEPGADAMVHTYEVRGRITTLPEASDQPGHPGQELTIYHEAIDDFRNSEGEIDPMAPMAMPFPPGPDVSLEGFEVGDKVLATLVVQWAPETGWTMTEIEKLPPDTELDLTPDAGEDAEPE